LSAVEQSPAERARTIFTPVLDVDFANKGESDAGHWLSADEPAIEDVVCLAACCEFAETEVIGLDGEGADVDECGEKEGDQEICDQDLDGSCL